MKKTLLILPIILLTFSINGCNDDDQNHKEKILGKWQRVEIGWTGNIIPIEESKGLVIEFLSNGKLRYYINDQEYLENYTYQIDNNFLYQNIISDEEAGGGRWTYKYLFHNDMLKLEIVDGIVTNYDIVIYKKQ